MTTPAPANRQPPLDPLAPRGAPPGASEREALYQTLTRCGQTRLSALLREPGLTDEAREHLLAQCVRVAWDDLAATAHATVAARPAVQSPRVITLAERAARAAELESAGAAAYRAGHVAVLMVAGGQGTRLGSDLPKGCFPLGPLSHKSLYQIQAEKVGALSRAYGAAVPLLIMTSPATDEVTRRFFAEHRDFGLRPGQVRFFCQGQVPSLDLAGQALLAGPDALLLNPDGHGGCFTALCASGELDRLQAEGHQHLVYIQVDNLLAPVDDPILVGLAVVERAEVLTKVLEKVSPDERVGHLVRLGARDAIIEYTELSAEEVRQRGPDGELLYRYGSPALHCFSVAFLAALWARGVRLPLHRSQKPLLAYDAALGQRVTTQGYKCERFIFDLLPAAERSLGLVIDRAAEFAPVKNRSGADSPQSAVALATDLSARWLTELGVAVALPPEAVIEISPRYAATRAELQQRLAGGHAPVTESLYLEEA